MCNDKTNEMKFQMNKTNYKRIKRNFKEDAKRLSKLVISEHSIIT